MKLLAIELSSRLGSLALIDDGDVAAEKSWEEDFRNRRQLFDALRAMQVDWDQIDGFVAGRGPGAFSGMRIAFSVANALAAAGKKPVHALNSAAALAAAGGAEQTVVAGDARRGKVWAGAFCGTELRGDFRLMAYDELADFVPEGAQVVSPDADRLAELLAARPLALQEVPRFPTAGVLGQLVHDRILRGAEPEPLEPLYLHPPVFVEPRYSGNF